jgi:hypothetical protein
MNPLTKAILDAGQLYLGIILSVVSIVWVAIQSRRTSEALRLAKEAHAWNQEERDEAKTCSAFCEDLVRRLAPEAQAPGARNTAIGISQDHLRWAKWGERQRLFGSSSDLGIEPQPCGDGATPLWTAVWPA